MNEDEKPNPGGQVCILIVNGVFAYFFYKYAFNNPDEGSCFAKGGNETAYGEIPMISTGSGEDAIQTPEEGFLEVSQRFQTWFFYGFVLNCIGIGQTILTFLGGIIESKVIDGIAKLIGIVLGLCYLAWYIAGAIFRWSFTGKVCSGDFVEDGQIK